MFEGAIIDTAPPPSRKTFMKTIMKTTEHNTSGLLYAWTDRNFTIHACDDKATFAETFATCPQQHLCTVVERL